MNWEETIKYIRTLSNYNSLVEKAYFDEDLKLNVERFRISEEYKETITLLKKYAPEAQTILDIGSGNGISALAFALDHYKVTVSEPDSSETVGAGAVRKLKEIYGIDDLEVHEEFAEKIEFKNGLFDVIYVRQALHHAYDLNQFVRNLSDLLKPGGLLLTIRDHVVFDEKDRQWFLKEHPLHKFYGGENAFTSGEYEHAIEKANLKILKKLKHYDSVINYFPLSSEEFKKMPLVKEKEIEKRLKNKIGFLSNITVLKKFYKKKVGFNKENFYDEKKIPGRMYSYVAIKT